MIRLSTGIHILFTKKKEAKKKNKDNETIKRPIKDLHETVSNFIKKTDNLK